MFPPASRPRPTTTLGPPEVGAEPAGAVEELWRAAYRRIRDRFEVLAEARFEEAARALQALDADR